MISKFEREQPENNESLVAVFVCPNTNCVNSTGMRNFEVVSPIEKNRVPESLTCHTCGSTMKKIFEGKADEVSKKIWKSLLLGYIQT